jgi:hypothetical protein
LPDVETTLGHKASVLDIALVSGSVGTVNRDAIYGLLNECLKDVSSAMLVVPYLVVCCWVSNVSLFLY